MAENAGFPIVAGVRGKDGVEEVLAKFGIKNREDDFHTAVKVAGHEISAANKDERIAGIGKDVDSTVFQKTIDNASHADVFA